MSPTTPRRAPISSRPAPSPTQPQTSTSASIWRRTSSVLLTIDAGNTQMVIGLYDGENLLEHWRGATVIDRSADQHAMLLGQMLDLKGFDFEQAVTGMAVCSSVPNLT